MIDKIPKFFFVDTETNGLDPKVHSPWQIAGIVESKHFKENGSINIKMSPFLPEKSAPKALELGQIDGEQLTVEHFKKMQSSQVGLKKLTDFLKTYCDTFNKNDKMIIVGYNVGFDKDMLYHFWKRCSSNYFFSFFEKYVIDVFAFVQPLWLTGVIDTPNCKLSTICDYYGIKIDAHDALSDIEATRELFYKITAPYLRSFFNKE